MFDSITQKIYISKNKLLNVIIIIYSLKYIYIHHHYNYMHTKIGELFSILTLNSLIYI